jgi:bifunctional ADP-heptose synthase (sugar kinase/adenylyltransferase)
MNRVIVIGDLLTDHYRFLKPLRSDPANNVALVVESGRQEMIDGGADNLVRNLKSLCGEDVHFWYARGNKRPTKIWIVKELLQNTETNQAEINAITNKKNRD